MMADKSNVRRFTNAGEAHTELVNAFNQWSSFLTTRSIEAALGIIAVNWAVYGSTEKILSNQYAKWSLITVIVFLGLNLLGTYWMAHLSRWRCRYADENRERWNREFNEASKKGSDWPYTPLIHGVGFALRELKVWVPILAGILFLMSLFPGCQFN
jgi:hypothetical protein